MEFITKLNRLRDDWRKKYEKDCPEFDYVSEFPPHTLILLETPGSGVSDTGKVSMSNNDPTARELSRLVDEAFKDDMTAKEGILLWNAIPWFINKGENKKTHLQDAKKLHTELLNLLRPDLKFLLLLGEDARKLLPHLSSAVGDEHIYGGHHTGRQAQQKYRVEENEKVFKILGEKYRKY